MTSLTCVPMVMDGVTITWPVSRFEMSMVQLDGTTVKRVGIMSLEWCSWELTWWLQRMGKDWDGVQVELHGGTPWPHLVRMTLGTVLNVRRRE